MAYKTVSQDGPEWLPKAVVCKVWNNYEGHYEGHAVHTGKIIGISCDGDYLDSMGVLWDNAEPVEEWEPKEGERVIAWDANSNILLIGYYSGLASGLYAIQNYGHSKHIARLKNPDGSMVDIDCTIEELKQRTEWK